MLPAKIYGTGEKVILSVEDDNASFQLLDIGFREAGGDLRLYRVTDGRHALDFLRRFGPYASAPKPDLVLLNLNLPRVSGFDVLEAIRDDPSIQDIPAVVFSSSSLDRDKARCLALGARAFMSKPMDWDEFQHAVREICALL